MCFADVCNVKSLTTFCQARKFLICSSVYFRDFTSACFWDGPHPPVAEGEMPKVNSVAQLSSSCYSRSAAQFTISFARGLIRCINKDFWQKRRNYGAQLGINKLSMDNRNASSLTTELFPSWRSGVYVQSVVSSLTWPALPRVKITSQTDLIAAIASALV